MKFAAVAILSLATAVLAAVDPEHCGPQYGNVVCKDNNCCSQYGWVSLSTNYPILDLVN